jgi:hypothetical protein
MSTSTKNTLFSDLTYVTPLKDSIIKSGGTIVFIKDNLILATEISEAQYRELLNSPYVDKMDILPIKRYGYDTVPYQEVITTDPIVSVDSVIVTNKTTLSPDIIPSTKDSTSFTATVTGGGGGCPTPDMKIKISDKKYSIVDDLKEGQNIYTIHEKTKKIGYFKISKLEKIMQQIVKVSFGYDFVTVSDSHKFLTENDEYVSISDISVGVNLKTLTGYKKITEIVEIGFGTVIRIEVEDAHTYIINDLISHNKQKALTDDSITNQNNSLL